MKTYVNLLKILFILLILWGALNFFMPKEDKKVLTNVTELYSKFTPYTKDYVNQKLEYIGCEPKKYYMEDREFCFICNNENFCFIYTFVNTTNERKIAVVDINTTIDFGIKYVDFFTNGLATLFNCKKINNTHLLCDYGLEIDKSHTRFPTLFYYKNTEYKDEILNKLCKHIGGEEIIKKNEIYSKKNVTVETFDCVSKEGEKLTTIDIGGGYLLI